MAVTKNETIHRLEEIAARERNLVAELEKVRSVRKDAVAFAMKEADSLRDEVESINNAMEKDVRITADMFTIKVDNTEVGNGFSVIGDDVVMPNINVEQPDLPLEKTVSQAIGEVRLATNRLLSETETMLREWAGKFRK